MTANIFTSFESIRQASVQETIIDQTVGWYEFYLKGK